MAIDDVRQPIATRDDVIGVPVIHLDRRLEIVGVTQIGNHTFFVARRDMHHLPARSQKLASTLFIQKPGELVIEIHVGLIALEYPLADFGHLNAAVLNAGVGRVHFEVYF